MKILKYILIFILFFYAFIVFAPKENFYYALEKKLEAYGVYISEEQVDSSLHSLNLTKSLLIYNDMTVGQIDNLTISSLLLYSHLSLSNAKIESRNFPIFPSRIDTLRVSHTIFLPQKLTISIVSDLGSINGFIDLYKQKIYLHLTPNQDAKQKYSNILGYFTPQQEGIYTYEKNISLY